MISQKLYNKITLVYLKKKSKNSVTKHCREQNKKTPGTQSLKRIIPSSVFAVLNCHQQFLATESIKHHNNHYPAWSKQESVTQ